MSEKPTNSQKKSMIDRSPIAQGIKFVVQKLSGNKKVSHTPKSPQTSPAVKPNISTQNINTQTKQSQSRSFPLDQVQNYKTTTEILQPNKFNIDEMTEWVKHTILSKSPTTTITPEYERSIKKGLIMLLADMKKSEFPQELSSELTLHQTLSREQIVEYIADLTISRTEMNTPRSPGSVGNSASVANSLSTSISSSAKPASTAHTTPTVASASISKSVIPKTSTSALDTKQATPVTQQTTPKTSSLSSSSVSVPKKESKTIPSVIPHFTISPEFLKPSVSSATKSEPQAPSQTAQTKQTPTQQAPVQNNPETQSSKEFIPTPEQWNDLHDVLSKNYPIQIFEPGHLAPTTSGMYGSNEDYTTGSKFRQYNNTSEGIKVAEKLKTAETVVLGDLHASSLKLLETLVMSEMVYLPADKAKRFMDNIEQIGEEFFGVEGSENQGLIKNIQFVPGTFETSNPQVDIQKTEALHPGKLARMRKMYKEIIEIIPHISWKGSSNRKLLLIGDVIFDRNVCDSITIRLLAQIESEAQKHGNQKPFVITASNHDWKYFVDFYKDSRSHAFSRVFESENNMKILYREYYKNLDFCHYDEKTQSLFAHTSLNMEGKIYSWEILKVILGYEAHETIDPKDFEKRSNEYIRSILSKESEYREGKEITNDDSYSFGNSLDKILQIDPNQKQEFIKKYNGYIQSGKSNEQAIQLASLETDIFVIIQFAQTRGLAQQKNDMKVANQVHGHDFKHYSKILSQDSDFTAITLDNDVRKDSVSDDNHSLYIY
jgi:hypothetical protein